MEPLFFWGGISSQNYGIRIKKASLSAGAERDVEKLVIPGRSGELIIDNGRYANVLLNVPCTCVASAGNDAVYARKIKGWLLSRPGEYLPLETSEDPDYFRDAAFHGPVDIENIANGYMDFEIVFDCKPYQYSKYGQRVQDVTQKKQLFNPESFPSQPYIRITGSGDIRLTVGNRTWDFGGVDGSIEVDSEIMNTFKGTLPQNVKKKGDGYPELSPGMNGFAWTGDVSKVEVKPRWRTL